MEYHKLIREIPDFPKENITFKDITPLLGHPHAFKKAIEDMAKPFLEHDVHLVTGIESRGFMFAPGIAHILQCGFAPLRKPGKLPYQTEKVDYDLEYGTDGLEIHIDALASGKRVLVVDDVLATGGTAKAASELVNRIGGEIVGFSFLIELSFLQGRLKLDDHPNITSLITY